MSKITALRVGVLCILLAILCMPPHVAVLDGIIGAICAIYTFLIITSHRRSDA